VARFEGAPNAEDLDEIEAPWIKGAETKHRWDKFLPQLARHCERQKGKRPHKAAFCLFGGMGS
jgi:hypothetical protein